MKETQLYKPVKELFEKMGYTVNSEVSDMDVTAVRGDELVVIELKTSMNLTLILQAVNRQKVANQVYVAIPRPKNRSKRFGREFKDKEYLLRRLCLGLILVAVDSPVPYAKIEMEPKSINDKVVVRRNLDKRQKTINEINKRHGDYNEGGVTGRKIVTAYRENALKIAGLIEIAGEMSLKDLKNAGCGVKTGSILIKNFYGWFLKNHNDLYILTKKASEDLERYRELVNILIYEHITKDDRIICIRKAKISDAKILTDITLSCVNGHDNSEECMIIKKLKITGEYIKSNTLYVAEVECKPVGYWAVGENKDDTWIRYVFKQKGYWLDYLYVKPEYMNLGVGRRMFSHMMEYAKSNGIDKIFAFVNNEAAGFFDKMNARAGEEIPSDDRNNKYKIYEIII